MASSEWTYGAESGAELDGRLVDRVAVADAHPGLDALFVQPVDRFVEPLEVVDALLLFALGPAALDASVFGAELADVVFVDAELGLVTVECFAADGPIGRFDVFGVAR